MGNHEHVTEYKTKAMQKLLWDLPIESETPSVAQKIDYQVKLSKSLAADFCR
jgi:hypothetical protein